MDYASLFSQLSIVIVIGGIMTLVMQWLRQPLLIGYVLTGLISGPLALDIIKDKTGFEVLSTLGVALLLFVAGLELSLHIIKKLSRVVFITTVVQILAVTAVSAVVARIFDFGRLESFILGVCLALSSTVIIISLLHNKKETTRLYAQIAIGVLLLQDLLATGAKILLSANSHGETLEHLLVLLGKGAIAIGMLYVCGNVLIPKLTRYLQSSKDVLLIFFVGWALGWSVLFAKIGFSVEVGALFAGISLASLPLASEVSVRLRPLRDFFIIIFFITLGQSILLDDVRQYVLPILAFTGIVVLLKPLIVLITMGLVGYTKRTSLKTAISLSQVSEFSLIFIVAAVHSNYIRPEAQAIIGITAVVSFVISSYLIKYDDELFEFFVRRFKLFEHHSPRGHRRSSLNYPVVLFGYRKGGLEFIRTFESMNKKFLVVDYDPDAIEQLERQNVPYFYGDAHDGELVEEINLADSSCIVSTIGDREVNEFLASWIEAHNPHATFIASADNAADAEHLYDLGAAYVLIPHFIGSEKISNFLKRSGLKKSEFKKFREKHLAYLSSHYSKEL